MKRKISTDADHESFFRETVIPPDGKSGQDAEK